MDLDRCNLRVCAPSINELKGHEESLLSFLQTRRSLTSQRAGGCSSNRISCGSSIIRSSWKEERKSIVFASNVSGFGTSSAQNKQNLGICRLKPLAKSLSKGEMMEDGSCHGTFDNDQNGNLSGTDQTDRIQNSASALPGLIYPSAKTIGKSTNIVWQECMVKREERENILGQKGCVIWITGLSGSGKSTLACTLDYQLFKRGNLSYVLDGDNLRHGLNKNLGFSPEDRAENIRRIGEVARIFVDAGVICIASAISPYRKDRDACRALLQPGEFIEVYMDFPLKLCEERDPKGLYKLARAGKIKGFTGVDDPYEVPVNCEVVMKPNYGKCPSPAEMANQLVSYLKERGFLGQLCKA